MTVKEQSLIDALAMARVTELPKICNQGADAGFWIKAIVLVKKYNATENYVMAERKGDGRIVYKKDFGISAPISKLLAVYPYLFLDEERYLPKDRAARERRVREHFVLPMNVVSAMSDDDLLYKTREVAMYDQMMASAEEINVDLHRSELERISRGRKEIYESTKGRRKEMRAEASVEFFEDLEGSRDTEKKHRSGRKKK